MGKGSAALLNFDKFPPFVKPINTDSMSGPWPCCTGWATWKESHLLLTGSWQGEWAWVEISLIHIVHVAHHCVPEPNCLSLSLYFILFCFFHFGWKLTHCARRLTPSGGSFVLYTPWACSGNTRLKYDDQIWFSWQSFLPASNNLLTLNLIHTKKKQKVKVPWERLENKKENCATWWESHHLVIKSASFSGSLLEAACVCAPNQVLHPSKCAPFLKDPSVWRMHPHGPNGTVYLSPYFLVALLLFSWLQRVTVKKKNTWNLQLYLNIINIFDGGGRDSYFEFIITIISLVLVVLA